MLFARKDETVSTLQSKYNGRTGAMSIDNFARWLNRVTLAVAIIMIGWGISVIFTQPVTAWFATSSMIWIGSSAFTVKPRQAKPTVAKPAPQPTSSAHAADGNRRLSTIASAARKRSW